MLSAVLVILIILWFFGFIQIPGLIIRDVVLFRFFHKPVTLWNLLIFLVILWLIGLLPSPLRQIIVVLLLLWTLSVLGFITVTGFSHLLIIAIIIGVMLSLFTK